jgi:uncharacterized protein (TIGR02996 family)
MIDENGFLLAIHSCPEDIAVRLVYADWLEERADLRADYLRMDAQLAAMPAGVEGVAAIRRRMHALRTSISRTWLALIGEHHATESDEPDPQRVALASQVLGCPVEYVDEEGYSREIIAAAMNHLTDTLAYVECRSQRRGSHLDINFYLRVRGGTGRQDSWEGESYNPYFGCYVKFLDWYGEAVVVIYEEKHDTYICRFGLDCPATWRVITGNWVLDGRHLGYWRYQETSVRRLAIPCLTELPSLTASEASAWDLLPSKWW